MPPSPRPPLPALLRLLVVLRPQWRGPLCSLQPPSSLGPPMGPMVCPSLSVFQAWAGRLRFRGPNLGPAWSKHPSSPPSPHSPLYQWSLPPLKWPLSSHSPLLQQGLLPLSLQPPSSLGPPMGSMVCPSLSIFQWAGRLRSRGPNLGPAWSKHPPSPPFPHSPLHQWSLLPLK